MTPSPVVTLTLAGAIDATYRVGSLSVGEFVRAAAYEREVSGKGVNVAMALAAAGREAVAVVVMGADDEPLARDHGEVLRPVFVPGATRVNTSIIDAGGATTKVNAPAPPLDAETWRAAREAVLAEIDGRGAGWLVVSGTVPHLDGPGGGSPDLAGLMRAAADRGARVALDTSGAALDGAMADSASFSLVKPNADELAELTGRALRTIGDVEEAARILIGRGLTAVYASLGADGVLVVTDGATVRAKARAVRVANTAGAGDASLAGFLLGLGSGGLDDAEALGRAAASAAAWGAHAVAQETTIVRSLDGMPEAVVEPDPDRSERLTEPGLP